MALNDEAMPREVLTPPKHLSATTTYVVSATYLNIENWEFCARLSAKWCTKIRIWCRFFKFYCHFKETLNRCSSFDFDSDKLCPQCKCNGRPKRYILERFPTSSPF